MNKLLSLMLICFFLPACAIKTTTTSLIQGKELSRKWLGSQTTTDKIDLSVVNPYTVRIKRIQCAVEQYYIEYQGVTETKQETHQLDCSDAYFEYAIQNVTTLGVPFLYDTFTGYNIFRNKCIKKPPFIEVSAIETRDVIKQEITDNNSLKCKETPIANAMVTADLGRNTLNIATDTEGLAYLPQRKLAELDQSKSNSVIKFSYESFIAETVYIPKPKPEQNRILRADLNGITEDEAAEQQSDSDSMAMLTPEDTMATKNDSGSRKADSDPERNRMLRSDLNSVAGRKPDNQETQMMSKLNNETALKKGEAQKSGAAESAQQTNKMSRDMNSSSREVAAKPKVLAITEMPIIPDKDNAKKKAATSSPDLLSKGIQTTDNPTHESSDAAKEMIQPVADKKVKPRLIVYFDLNKTIIRKEFREKLKELAAEIRSNPLLTTSIEGHTDNVGSAEINLKMSIKRADAIRNYLIKTLHVPGKRIRIKGFGLDKPIKSNDTEEGRSANRRTEVIVITQTTGI